jgi:hypothetical protein
MVKVSSGNASGVGDAEASGDAADEVSVGTGLALAVGAGFGAGARGVSLAGAAAVGAGGPNVVSPGAGAGAFVAVGWAAVAVGATVVGVGGTTVAVAGGGVGLRGGGVGLALAVGAGVGVPAASVVVGNNKQSARTGPSTRIAWWKRRSDIWVRDHHRRRFHGLHETCPSRHAGACETTKAACEKKKAR